MKQLATIPGAIALALALALPAAALTLFDFSPFVKGGAVQISTDPFSNSSSQHATEVEPDAFAYGSTIVTAVQQGRFYDGGASDIGWATSTNGGKSWKHGSLPDITNVQSPPGPWDRVSDPAVVYDAKHGLWLISSLPLVSTTGQMPLVSSSKDGLNWNDPVEVAQNTGDFIDKDWITCDNTKSSKYVGHCYVEFDDASLAQVYMTTSSDGGKTWSQPYAVPNAYGLGGQPVVQPGGTVVVPWAGSGYQAFTSTDGGNTWGNVSTIDGSPNFFYNQNGLRNPDLPSAEIDGAGNVYVAWADCSFRSGCSSNDIVYSVSSDGVSWSSPARVPIDPLNSTVDHFIPGMGVDPATSGKSAHLAVTYYFLPQANCSPSTCQLMVGTIESANGGATWTKPKTLAGPINVQWLATTDQGYMVGDYIATAWANGLAHGAFAVATAPKGKFNEFLASDKAGEKPAEIYPNNSWGERPIRGMHRGRPTHILPI